MPVMGRGRTGRIGWTVVAVPLLLLVAAALRLSDLNWDDGHLFHPDERYILMVTEGLRLPVPLDVDLLLSPDSPLNPRGFAYGSLIFYLLKAIQWAILTVGDLLGVQPVQNGWFDPGIGGLRLVGRSVSALFDTGTVLLTYLLARRLYGWRVGLLAAAFLALSVLNIQLSHFYASDTPMTFFVTLTLLLSATYVDSGRRRHALWAGFVSGLALASKVSAAPVLAAVAAAHLLRSAVPAEEAVAGGAPRRLCVPDAGALSRAVGLFALAMVPMVVAFVVFQPYAVIDVTTFVRNVAEQNAMVRGTADLPYTRQYIDRPAYWYFLQNLALFGVGLPLGVAMIGGWLYAIYRALRAPVRADLLLLAFALPYFAVTGSFQAKFIRYLLPLMPVLATFAALGLMRLYQWAAAGRSRRAAGPRTEWVEVATEAAWPAGGPALATPMGSNGQAAEPPPDLEPYPLVELPIGTSEYPGRARPDPVPVAYQSTVPAAGCPADARAAVAQPRENGAAIPIGGLAETQAPPTAVDRGAQPVDEVRHRWASAPRPSWLARAVAALIALVVLATGFYALAYQNVYAGEHTAVEASRWIYANVPRGSTIATEHWEEGMPVPIRVGDRQLDPGSLGYRPGVTLPMYENDDAKKLGDLSRGLAQSDYVVFFSNRLYGTVPRLPDRYPMSRRYYELLFGEQLGFRLVAAFQKYPQLLGVALVDDTLSDPRLPTPELLRIMRPAPISINLGRADEAFSVYDHPKVLIFQKVEPWTEAQFRAALAPGLANVAGSAQPPVAPRSFKSLLLSPAQVARDRVGGTFSALFDRDGVANQAPALVWVLVLIAIGLAALPTTVLVFPRLADGGLPLARTLGLLAMTWISWIVVAAGGASAGTGTTYLGLVALIALGAALLGRARGRLRGLWRERRAALIGGELAFWLPFAYFVGVRMANPDLWHPARGGEKPMDVAYLMAAIKSTTYPPYDPWFAGGFLNYYYFGQLIAANLIKLTGVVPTTAYNLVVPTLFALTFAGVYCLAYNLCRRLPAVSERLAVAGGIVAGLFVTTIGNLRGPIQIGEALVRISGMDYQSLLPGAQYVVLALVGLFNWITGKQPLQIGTDWYWASSRVIQGSAITEFPYFTFLYADLHAHLIALPFAVLAIGIALDLIHSAPVRVGFAPVAAPTLGFAVQALPRQRLGLLAIGETVRHLAWPAPEALLRLVVTGLAVGVLLPMNAWDFPTYLGLVSICGLAPWYLAARRDLSSFLAAIARIGTVALLSYGLYMPFHQNFVSFYSGVKPTPEQSDLGGYLTMNGLFLVVLGSYVVLDVAAALRRSGFLRTLSQLGRRWDRLPHLLELRRRLIRRDDGSATATMAALLGMIAITLVGSALGFTVAGLLLALLLPVVWRLLARPRAPENAFVMLLIATGLAIGLGVELIVIDGDVGRMNTVFKFYLQVWTMWGIASAVALVAMRDRLRAIARPGPGRWWAGTIALLLAGSLFYPIIATRARVADRFDPTIPPTLDGTAYMETAVYRDQSPEVVRPSALRLAADRRAIEWMWDNVAGSPAIAEGLTPLYRWGSRFSIYTGLPAIVGWDHHQKQQRGDYLPGMPQTVDERTRDVRVLYTDPSPQRAMEILTRYDVRYLIVGELERAYYPETGLRKFEQMVGSALEVVYDQDGVRIYRVIGAAQ